MVKASSSRGLHFDFSASVVWVSVPKEGLSGQAAHLFSGPVFPRSCGHLNRVNPQLLGCVGESERRALDASKLSGSGLCITDSSVA